MTDPFLSFAEGLRRFIAAPPHLPDELEATFNRLASDLFQFQRAHNPTYANWCRLRGVVSTPPPGWRDLPAIPTAAFQEWAVTSIPEADRTHVFHSSGTTSSRPSRHYHHQSSLQLYETSLRVGFFQQLSPPRTRRLVFSLTPPPETAPHSSLAHMFGTIVQDWGVPGSGFFGDASSDGWVVDTDRLSAALETASQGTTPVFLGGTAFNWVHWIESRADRPLSRPLPPGSQLMETGGYKGRSRVLPREELHAELSRLFQLPAEGLLTEYGMSELSSQAYAHGAAVEGTARTLRFPHWARALVVSPDTGREVADGESGLLRIIDLANAWSVLAIQTSDVAIRRGTDFELLGRAPGAEPRGCSLLSLETA